jgi:hypothetical protein
MKTSDPPPTFSEVSLDAEGLLGELDAQLKKLRDMMLTADIRRKPAGRRLAATIERHRRISKILTTQLAEARDLAQKHKALRRLGRQPKGWNALAFWAPENDS